MLALVVAFSSVGLLLGLELGRGVTRRLHRTPPWDKQLGRSRFRYANLPAGFAVFLAVSAVLPSSVAWPVRAMAVGMLLAALGWAYVDPAP